MIALTVNDRDVRADVEPRTHLADFLRDKLNLTGTHLGCEHGVCGACTLLLDDAPARSCITYAVACDGARVTTIEGLDDDEITTELRGAFAREHALQCGYCTPGMLVSARDLVLRMPSADERDIRVGMSGNLCRCTGYVGIVRAVRSVIEARRRRGVAPVVGAGRTLFGPVGSGHSGMLASSAQVTAEITVGEPPATSAAGISIEDFSPEHVFGQDFVVPHSPAEVFAFFGDIPAVAACLPGASVSGAATLQRTEGTMQVKFGPIAARFKGAVRIERDPTTLSGRIVGAGTDQRSRSSSRGEIRYRLMPDEQSGGTRAMLSIGYSLRGMLAQFARPGLVSNLTAAITADFVRNIDRALSGVPTADGAGGITSLNFAALLNGVLQRKLRQFFRGRGQGETE
jgi:carbon-monoxide dehydrogenase small subunit